MDRLGTYADWMTETEVLARLVENFRVLSPRLEKDLTRLAAYAEGRNEFTSLAEDMKTAIPAQPPFASHVKQALRAARKDQLNAQMACLRYQPWESWIGGMAREAAYGYWQTLLDLHPHFVNQSFNSAISELCALLYLGWEPQAQTVCRHIHSNYRDRRFFDVNGEFGSPLHHWISRVCFAYFDLSFNEWGKTRTRAPQSVFEKPECLSEPVLNELFEHWRDPDLTPMQEHLLWLCDYYTHRTAPDIGMELGNSPFEARFPILILAWFRLRQQLGLDIPVIDHPLMTPAFVLLPPRQPPYADELLREVIARLLMEETPTLGQLVDAQGWIADQSRHKNWLAKLIGVFRGRG